MPTPTLGEAFRLAIEKGRNLGPRGMPVTLERVTAVFADGRVEVRGVRVPVTGAGARAIRSGQQVALAWQAGRPVVAIVHTARRSGPVTPSPRAIAPLVEELFIATRPDGIVDIYFRNFDDVTPLRLDRFINTAGFSTLRWGALNDRFFVQEGTKYHVFKLDREPDEPFAAGSDPSDGITLERTEDLSTNTTVLAVVPGVGNVTPQDTLRAQRISVSLAVDGSLIGSFRLHEIHPFNAVWANTPAPNFRTTPTNANTFPAGGEWPIIADLTNRVVLFSGYTNHEAFLPSWAMFDPNTPTNTTVFDNLSLAIPVGDAFFRSITWVPGNSFVTPMDPPFEGHTEIITTWQFGYSETPSRIIALAEPILVLGADVQPNQRIRGLVAWTERQFLVHVGQTFDVANWTTFITFSGQPGYFPVPPIPPFPVTGQTGALARAALLSVTRDLYPLARPAVGLSYAPTVDRVIWRKTGSVQFVTADGGLNAGGADSAGFVTLFLDGATVQVTPTLRASVGQRGLVPVMTDFLYQLDNPVTALPPNADVNFFVDAWAFGGATTLNTAAADFPVELGELEEAKPLADIPEGVVQPTSAGMFSLYVNNDPATLEALGLFEELPGAVV